jgi:hypothetical protein
MIFLQRTVDHVGALARPLLGRRRLVADDVLAPHVLELLRVTPVLRVAVLHPEDAGCHVWWHVLDVLGVVSRPAGMKILTAS